MPTTIYLDQNVLSDLRYRKLNANPTSPFAYIYIHIKEQKFNLLYSDVHLKEIKQITKEEYVDEHIYLLHDTMAIHIDHELEKLNFIDPYAIWKSYNKRANNTIEQSVIDVLTKIDKKISGVKVDQSLNDLFNENSKNAQLLNAEVQNMLINLREEDFKDTNIDFKLFKKMGCKAVKEQQNTIKSIDDINFDNFKCNDPNEAKQWFNNENINFDDVPPSQIVSKITKVLGGNITSFTGIREEVLHYYKLLNLCGYYMDDYRSSKKGKDRFNASQNDMEHVANGFHANYFISNDGDLNQKAKAVYMHMNIPTEVVTPDEFKEITA